MIATKTNLEITEYREKFFLGLSLRQLACFAAAAVLAIDLLCLSALAADGYAGRFLYRHGGGTALSGAGLHPP